MIVPLRLISLLPRPLLIHLANVLGTAAYYCARTLRKTALSNISLAFPQISRRSKKNFARRSFCHLALTLLEYGLIERKKGDLSSFATCLNPGQATDLQKKHGGIIYVSAHIANWEVPFIETNTRACGIAVGRPLSSIKMTARVNAIRASTGGHIVSPREAMQTAKRRLKEGYFFGFVGDQGLPESSYSGSFLGRLAFSTSAPALLAYRNNVPIVVANTCRRDGKQIIWYAPPIYPDRSAPLKQEVIRLSDAVMRELEMGIIQAPEQWMWLHNRWKRPTGLGLLKEFRYETILILYPKDPQLLALFLEMSDLFRMLYPHHDIAVCLPSYHTKNPIPGAKVFTYEDEHEAFIDTLDYKLVYNFTDIPKIERFYQKQCALMTFGIPAICKKLKITRAEFLSASTKHFCHSIYEDTEEPTAFLSKVASNRAKSCPSQVPLSLS